MIFKKWLTHKVFTPIHLLPGDTFQITYTDSKKNTTVLDDYQIEQRMTVNQARIFEAEVDGKRALGGVIIEE